MTGHRAAIVIPAKNAAGKIETCLDAIFSQRYVPGFEVLVVDSGSSDETPDIVRRYPARLLQILPEEVSHGGTRNLGASQTTGEFIVFLTQDAFPVGHDWLQNLVAPFDLDDTIAGCFGPHVAHVDADPVDAWNLERHFANFGPRLRIFRLDAEHESEYRQLEWIYDFFSDNNSALRRSIWERYPLPRVDMAEDQHWMKMVMRHGYAKAYSPDAVVAHSHSYSIWQWTRNWYDQHASYHDLGSPVAMRRLSTAGSYVLRTSREDLAYLRRRSSDPSCGWRSQARAVANNVARGTGGYLGANYPRLPRVVRRRLSMQRRGEASGK